MMAVPPWLMTAFSAWIFAFALAIIVHYARLTLRGFGAMGGRDYFYLVALRDVRVWIVVFWIIMQSYYFLFEEHNGIGQVPLMFWAVLLTPFCMLFKGLAPPQVLLLHTFDDRNYDFSKQLAHIVPLPNLVSLYPGARSPWDWRELLERIGYGVGARVSKDEEWRLVVKRYIQLAEVIVIDLSHARQGLIEELGFLQGDQSSHDKVVFVCGSRDDAEFAYEEFRKHFPTETLFEYSHYEKTVGPVTRPNPMTAAILGKLSTHFILPLIPPAKFQRDTRNWTLCGPAGTDFLEEVQAEVNLSGRLELRKTSFVKNSLNEPTQDDSEQNASRLRLRFDFFHDGETANPSDIVFLVGGWVNASLGEVIRITAGKRRSRSDCECGASGRSPWTIKVGERTLSSPDWTVCQLGLQWEAVQTLSAELIADRRQSSGSVEVEVMVGSFPYDTAVRQGNTEESQRYAMLLEWLVITYPRAFEDYDVWL